jgi:hypothetical protein
VLEKASTGDGGGRNARLLSANLYPDTIV